jgi:predicted CXXCH cytochrome family protein
MIRMWFLRVIVLGVSTLALPLLAGDAPHDFTADCESCHITHNAADAQLINVKGNANLCISCHTAGGQASTHPFATADQALPWPGLPSGTNAFGTSHRWDANAAGHVTFLGGTSTGQIEPSGVYTGVYPKTVTITITNAGNSGSARFNWTATTPGGGSGINLLTGTNVALTEGVAISFLDGSSTSFQVNDQWNLYLRPDLRNPTNATLLLHMTNGVAYCSACHDQHLQVRTPFDPAAPPYSSTNSVVGRHFMRIDNDSDQMCLDCHASRNVTNSAFGSHPVEITVATNAYYKSPSVLPREKATNKIACLTCHQVHYAVDNDGALLRLTNTVALCVDCHNLADTNSPAAHLVSTNSNMLWPGGQYGSLLPARTDTTLRGSCLNCHTVHGWTDAANPTNHYPVLLADREESLCFTCHDADGPAAKRVKTDFDLTRHHPVVNTDPYRRPGRSVECSDCHHVHDALPNSHVYTNTATSTRNQVTNPIKGVSGVAVATNGLTNYQVIHSSLYSSLSETNGGATFEYQVCFKCHSSYIFTTNSTGSAAFTTNSTTVTGSGTTWSSSLTGMWCRSR